MDIKQFSQIWPKLEELSVSMVTTTGDDVDLDETVFGLSPDWKKKIDKTEEEWWMKIPAPESGTTIANLKGLKKLIIEVDGPRGASAGILTDFGVYFGPRHMQNLEVLQVKSDIPTWTGVSTKAFNFLVNNLPKLEKLNLEWKNWERGEIQK